jgi:hypothetical protein
MDVIESFNILSKTQRDGEYTVSRGPTFGDFVTIRTEASMQDITVARLQSKRVQTPLSPSFKCNVLRESLSVDSQNHQVRTGCGR